MKILSLFDGMSCGRIALERAGIQVDEYYSSEIDKYAIQISQKNYPDIIQLGDVENWRDWDIGEIDMIIGGSPCQGFSFAGKQLAFDDPRSKLFFTMVDIIKHFKPKYFLLENVKMKKEFQDIISEYLGVQPIEINSALVSAQQRKRLYWTNIPGIEQPEDKGIYLKDIIEGGFYDGSVLVDGLLKKEIEEKVRVRKYKVDIDKLKQTLKDHKHISIQQIADGLGVLKTTVAHRFRTDNCFSIPDENIRLKLKELLGIHTDEFDKSITQFEIRDGRFDMAKRVYRINGKSPTITTITGGKQRKIIDDNEQIREITPLECERLQTVPDNYTEGVSNTQRYKMLGNGWTVDVIAHIFRFLAN